MELEFFLRAFLKVFLESLNRGPDSWVSKLEVVPVELHERDPPPGSPGVEDNRSLVPLELSDRRGEDHRWVRDRETDERDIHVRLCPDERPRFCSFVGPDYEGEDPVPC